jgi:hypothetical protein
MGTSDLEPQWRYFYQLDGNVYGDGCVYILRLRDDESALAVLPDGVVDINRIVIESNTEAEQDELRFIYLFYLGSLDPARAGWNAGQERVIWVQ